MKVPSKLTFPFLALFFAISCSQKSQSSKTELLQKEEALHFIDQRRDIEAVFKEYPWDLKESKEYKNLPDTISFDFSDLVLNTSWNWQEFTEWSSEESKLKVEERVQEILSWLPEFENYPFHRFALSSDTSFVVTRSKGSKEYVLHIPKQTATKESLSVFLNELSVYYNEYRIADVLILPEEITLFELNPILLARNKKTTEAFYQEFHEELESILEKHAPSVRLIQLESSHGLRRPFFFRNKDGVLKIHENFFKEENLQTLDRFLTAFNELKEEIKSLRFIMLPPLTFTGINHNYGYEYQIKGLKSLKEHEDTLSKIPLNSIELVSCSGFQNKNPSKLSSCGHYDKSKKHLKWPIAGKTQLNFFELPDFVIENLIESLDIPSETSDVKDEEPSTASWIPYIIDPNNPSKRIPII